MLKRTTSLLMVVAVMMTTIGFATIAKAETITPATDEGWSFDTATQTLTITYSATGPTQTNVWQDDLDTAGITAIKNVVFAEGVTSVANYQFGNNNNWKTIKDYEKTIESVSFPSTLTSVGIYAFAGRENLKTITYADPAEGVQLTIGTQAFKGCHNDLDMVIPDNTVSIGAEAFAANSKVSSSNSKIKSVHVPAGSVYERIFYNRPYVNVIFDAGEGETTFNVYGIHGAKYPIIVLPKNVNVPTETDNIGIDKVNGASIDSASVILTSENSSADTYAKTNGNTVVYIPEGLNVDDVGTCGTGIYWTWDNTAKELQFFGTGKINDGNAFWGVLPSFEQYTPEVKKIVINEGITEIPQNFMNKTIGSDSAFASSTTNGNRGAALVDVVFSEGLEKIGIAAFYNCTNYKAVTLPASLKTIMGNAFEASECNQGITTLNIPANSKLELIGTGAFHYGAINNAVEFPATLTSLGLNSLTVSNYGAAKIIFNGAYPVADNNAISWAVGAASYGDYSGDVYYPEYAASGFETYANYANLKKMTVNKSLTVADGTATVSFKNFTSNAIAGKMFVAAYDANDRFITVAAPVDVNIAGATTAPTSATKTFAINATGAKYYKAFVWDNMTNIKPQTEAIRKDV